MRAYVILTGAGLAALLGAALIIATPDHYEADLRFGLGLALLAFVVVAVVMEEARRPKTKPKRKKAKKAKRGKR